MTRLIAILLSWASLFTFVQAAEIARVDRVPYVPFLQGIIDFDQTTSAPFPGSPIRATLPFAGVQFSTYFKGQVPVLRKHGLVTYGATYGMPSAPLELGLKRNGKSVLTLITHPENHHDHHLGSRVWEPTIFTRDEAVGFGAIALKFSNRQFAFGFELEPREVKNGIPPGLAMYAYGIEGEPIGEPIFLDQFGQYTFKTDDDSRIISGLLFVNIGEEAVFFDEIVFELPLILG